MQLRRGRIAGFANRTDHIALCDDGVLSDQHAVEMRVGRHPAALMANEDQIAETFHLVTGINDDAGCGRHQLG